MSLFSSLMIVFPGVPPLLRSRDLQSFATSLQRALDIPSTQNVLVHLKYGTSASQDFDSPNVLARTQEINSYRIVRYQWNAENNGVIHDNSVWDRLLTKNIYRAYIGLGKLPKHHMNSLLSMASPNAQKEFIAPDSVSIQIDPICPCTLTNVKSECIGLMAVFLSGYNYFTWQPLSTYWQRVSKSDTVKKVMKLCSDTMPVPEIANLSVIKDQMGDLFLNASEYRSGDWIVSVSESG